MCLSKNCNAKLCKANFSALSFLAFFWELTVPYDWISCVTKGEKEMTVSQHLLQKKKRNNGFTWMVDQISGEEEEGERKKRTFFLCCIGPRKSPEAMRQKKSYLKRYFTIVVVWYSTFFTKLYLIDTAIHIGRTYLLLHYNTIKRAK